MKKLLSVSILAMIAVSPLAAQATTISTLPSSNINNSTENDHVPDAGKVASVAYVKGAYDAVRTPVNSIINAMTVNDNTLTNADHIANGADVAANLVSLNSAIRTIESSSVGTKQDGNYIEATNSVAEDLSALDTAIGTVGNGNYIVQSTSNDQNATTKNMGQNVQALDTAIGKLASGETYNYLTATEGDNKKTISQNLDALDTAIGSMSGFGSQHYAKSTTSVAENITSLDTQVKSNADEIAKIEGNDQTSGSILYAVRVERERAEGVEGDLGDLNDTGVLATTGANANLVAAINAVADKVDTSATNATVNNGTYIGSSHQAGTVSSALTALDVQVAANANNIGDVTELSGSNTNVTDLTAAINNVDNKQLIVYSGWGTGGEPESSSRVSLDLAGNDKETTTLGS